MGHRKSPARLQKARRITHFQQHAAQNTAPPPTDLAWDGLAEMEAAITGCVVVPGDPDYDKNRQESNPEFQRFPKVIVYCDNANAVAYAGGGCSWDTFNGVLSNTGWHVPTGACGGVCVGGFVQRGGYGYTSRG